MSILVPGAAAVLLHVACLAAPEVLWLGLVVFVLAFALASASLTGLALASARLRLAFLGVPAILLRMTRFSTVFVRLLIMLTFVTTSSSSFFCGLLMLPLPVLSFDHADFHGCRISVVSTSFVHS